MKHSVIYSADHHFAVLAIVQENHDIAWDIANELYTESLQFKGVEHCSVMTFNSLGKANEWVLKQSLSCIPVKS